VYTDVHTHTHTRARARACMCVHIQYNIHFYTESRYKFPIPYWKNNLVALIGILVENGQVRILFIILR